MSATEIYKLDSGDLAVLVSRRGASLRTVTFAGIPVMIGAGGPSNDMASFPLVPFGNRVEFNQFRFGGKTYAFKSNTSDPFYVHGDGWLRDWSVEGVGDPSIELAFEHLPDEQSAYHYRARQRITVSEDTLTLDLSVSNKAAETMPFGLGQHPFFVRTPSVRIKASADEYWSERAGHLPGSKEEFPSDLDIRTGAGLPKRFINNAFGNWEGTASIEWPELRLEALIETTPSHAVLMLYAPSDRQDFFCLEPMTHLPNAHHMESLGGLTLLKQSETLHSHTTIKFRRHDHG
ncbi:aldose 1-epimerase [Rhizobium sp. RM]|uniref:aldose 1-epimerase n=1 Tax=Rhizobium sp. RM TaxID=2748079 RepID=UPI00110E6D3C|nr:aldose 1-epimerase [Rhizobium sp. RM]NWJ25458.1 aldose 1-epimerase [Rhizobium sp. RM]TMV22089.1 aldose 1-epimerase [Rhizobium sp. Td3]